MMSSSVSSSSDEANDNEAEYSCTEQWNSKIFDMENESEDEELSLNDYYDVNIGSKTRKIIYPIYILIILAAIAMIFLGIFGDEMSSLISIISIITMTWVGVIIGMLGVYLWGTVEDAVDWFESQNKKFEGSVDELKKTRNKIKDVAQNVFTDVRQLQKHSKELTQHLGAFEELRASLQETCGKNQELGNMLDQINEQYADMVTVISENEKASLLSIFYEVSTLDRKEGLSRREYQRFLGRLNKKTRELFIENGDFDALDVDGSGRLELCEFEQIIESVLRKQENLKIQHYMVEGK